MFTNFTNPRFCPERYHPFDEKEIGKYVIGDDYLPIWNVSSLKPYYSDLGFGMKESFNAYLLTLGTAKEAHFE